MASQDSASKPIYVSVLIENVKLNMEVDTGSAVSLISKKLYDKCFSKLPIQLTKTRLTSYTGEIIQLLGFIEVSVRYEYHNKKLNLFVIPNGGPSFLGRTWLKALNVDIVNNSAVVNRINLQTNASRLNYLSNKYKCVSEKRLGLYKNFKAKLYLKPNSLPVFFGAIPLPFSMKEKVESELNRLVSEGILSPVDHNEWSSAIVPVIKRNGDIRLCGDFKVSVNPNLYIHRYPIPRIEHIFLTLQGGKLFSKNDLLQAHAQIELNDNSKQLVTINTPKGLFTPPELYLQQRKIIVS